MIIDRLESRICTYFDDEVPLKILGLSILKEDSKCFYLLAVDSATVLVVLQKKNLEINHKTRKLEYDVLAVEED